MSIASPDYKALQRWYEERASTGRLLEPTLHQRINRLSPAERDEVSLLVRRLKLRKIIRRTLAEAFWRGQQDVDVSTMERLQRYRASEQKLDNENTAEKTYAPAITQSGEAQRIILDPRS